MTNNQTPRYVVEPSFEFWQVRDTQFQGPGSVFNAPVKSVVTTKEAAEHIADEYNEKGGK